MRTIEYHWSATDGRFPVEEGWLQKEDWGEGPWTHEPDKAQWVDPISGFPCLIVRGPLGALCGYVGVPRRHPTFHVGYDDVYAIAAARGVDLYVHGGLTFSGFCAENADESADICHVVEEGEDDLVWWLGFDCGHAGDYMPAMEARYRKILEEKPDLYADLPFPDLFQESHRPYDHAERLNNPRRMGLDDLYKTIGYVRRECRELALQLSRMAPLALPT